MTDSGPPDVQKAVWAAGGTQLLEALLSLGALEKRRCSEDATRLLQAVVSAPQNRDGILQSGGTDLLVKLLRLGPRKVNGVLH